MRLLFRLWRTGIRELIAPVPLLLWAIWIVFIVEVLARGSWEEAIRWTFGSVRLFGLNMVVSLAMLLLASSMTANIRYSLLLVSAASLAFGLLCGAKLRLTHIPLQPWDWLMNGDKLVATPFFSALPTWTNIAGLSAFAVSGFAALYYKLHSKTSAPRWNRRILWGCVSALLLLSLYVEGTFTLKRIAHVQNINWDQSENVSTNGLLLTTVMNTRYIALDKPAPYNDDLIRSLANSAPPAAANTNEVKPTIIVVLSESFWDPTQIKGLTFSRDPAPFFHKLSAHYSSGTMLSPQYGGGTANVEFEVLTGNSMRFLPEGSIPYNEYIHRGVDSLASILSRQGYATTAISSYYSWFSNSKNVYERFGFSKYVSEEFFDRDFAGPYLADRGVAKQIIRASESSPGPDFIYANTMENHYEYTPDKFKENTVQISGVAGESKGMLETLAQGLTGADAMLQSLVEHYERSSEPTIIVFFGDHLPKLGNDYQAYRDSGYLQRNDPDFVNKMYRVPVVIWNNYLPEQRDRLDMSPSFLGPYILKLAQRQGSYFTDYLNRLAETIPVIPPRTMYAQLGINDEQLQGYRTLQYDILFGQQYAYRSRQLSVMNPNYMLGTGIMQVDRVQLEHMSAGSRLTVGGRNLPPQAFVEVNGMTDPALRSDDGDLTATIGSAPLLTPPYKIEVVVQDSRGDTIARSKSYMYTDPATVK